jgi:hypothetical protein
MKNDTYEYYSKHQFTIQSTESKANLMTNLGQDILPGGNVRLTVCKGRYNL